MSALMKLQDLRPRPIADELKAWRFRHRLSQAQAAAAAGFPHATWRGWELGRTAGNPGFVLATLEAAGAELKGNNHD